MSLLGPAENTQGYVSISGCRSFSFVFFSRCLVFGIRHDLKEVVRWRMGLRGWRVGGGKDGVLEHGS